MSGHLEWNPLKYGDALGLTYGPLSGHIPGKLTDHALNIQEDLNPGISRGALESANDAAPYIAAAIATFGGSLLGSGAGAGMAEGGAGLAGGAGGAAEVFPVGAGGGPEIAGFATGADPFVSASGGSMMGAPGTMATPSAAASPMTWQNYARMANMGSSLMGSGQPQQQPQQPYMANHGVLMMPQQQSQFMPVYPGVLQPFIQR